MDEQGIFVLGRNPEPASSLPYLVQLPIDGRPVIFKTRDRWPTTGTLYCHVLPEWPEDSERLEIVPIRSCERRGTSVDLVLDRALHSRSMLVFTTRMILWQSARTIGRVRPSLRLPGRPTPDAKVCIEVDTHEGRPYAFKDQPVDVKARVLTVGDYAVRSEEGEILAVVERKSLQDFGRTVAIGGMTYALAHLATVPIAAVVVEARYSQLLHLEREHDCRMREPVARLQARYPTVPIMFADTREHAEDWTYRFLAAVLANHASGERPPELS